MTPPQTPQWTADNDLGLSVCMLDVDRLRNWARNIAVHGADISRWGSVEFVQGRMERIADGLDEAVRDIGTLRAALTASAEREAALRGAAISLAKEVCGCLGFAEDELRQILGNTNYHCLRDKAAAVLTLTPPQEPKP